MAVELADLDLGPRLGVLDRHPAERDVLAQYRAPGAAGDHADLRAADVHAIAVAGDLVAGELEADERALRVRLALDQRLLADEVVAVLVQRDGEPDAGLERVDLVVELIVGEDQRRLDPQHVERREAEGFQPVAGSGLPDRVPDGGSVIWMAPDLEAELAGVARAGHDDRDPVVVADPADQEAEPAQVLERRLGRRRPDDLPQDLAAARALDREVVELVGRRLHPDAHRVGLGELGQVHAGVRIAGDEAEVVVGEPVHGRVVEHAAGLVADRRVGDLADRQLARVAGDRALDQHLGVGPEDLELAQRREVHDHRGLATGPVLGDRPFALEAVRQPVAAVLDQVAGEGGGARMEGGLLGHNGVGLRGHAVGDRHRESVLGSVHADVDFGDLPAVGRVDVVGARGRGAEQVVRRPQQDVVAGARPRLVGDQGVGQVKGRVVEEVERVPAGAGLDPAGHQLAVEVVGAVDVARIAEVLVVAREAGETEVVMAPDRVMDDLHQRVLIDVEALAIKAGRAGRPSPSASASWSHRARARSRARACGC